jgi:AcrR family transcriptional regulator
MRAIAADAGVDAALIAHFFGSKQQLFAEAVELPFDPAALVGQVLAADRSQAGYHLATAVMGVLESDGRQQMLSLIRSAATEPEAAAAIRTVITQRVLTPMVDGLSVPDAALRASLVSAQIVGLVMARYVVQIPPLAQLTPERVIAQLAPVLQHLLTGDLPS